MDEPSLFANLPDIETERLILRRLTIDDAPSIFEYASDPEVPVHMTWDVHESVDTTREFISMVLANYDDPQTDVWTWGIVLKETGRVVGACSIFGKGQSMRAELGYWIGRPYWGQGLVPEATRAMIKVGFEQMGLNRIEARAFKENVASARVMEKCGMTYEGTLREQMLVKGRFRDCKMYSILRREYDGQEHQGNSG
jgi:ribosomal-protein-alanine N-acetyltransferase